MIEIKNIEVYGLNKAINAIGNSFNVGEINTSLSLSDDSSKWKTAEKLGGDMSSHQSHDAFLKGILVEYDIKLNGAFQPEFMRYTVGQNFIMQQSTMHSLKKLMNENFDPYTKYVSEESREIVKKYYNQWVETQKKLAEGTASNKDVYEAKMKLIHNIPRGIELWATISSNYLQLKTQVIQRARHPQAEDWHSFIKFCYSLPKFRELCGFKDKTWDLENIFPILYEN